MYFAVFLFLCPFIVVASQEKTESNIRLVRFVATLPSKENNEAISTYTMKTTSPPPVASKNTFNNKTALINSMGSERQCKKRLSGVVFSVCRGCFHHEHKNIELKKFGKQIQKNNKNDKTYSVPWSKLNDLVMQCCTGVCSFADFKQLCCDGDEFRKNKK